MKCVKCGAEIRPGCVYCSNCGQEAQIVTEINILEDDLLRSMLEEEEKKRASEAEKSKEQSLSEKKDTKNVNAGGEKSGNVRKPSGVSPEEKKKKQLEKKRKKAQKTCVVLVVVLIAAFAVAFGVMQYNHGNSTKYQLKKAEAALGQKNYTNALEYVNRALQIDGENEDALLLEGQIFVLMKEDAKAETVFLSIIEQDADNVEAYKNLLELYEDNDSYDQILALKSTVTKSDILELFDAYLIETPEVDKDGGTYNEFIQVELSVKGKGLDIYYTLDGSTPTKDDKKYTSPIKINEQGKVTLMAVAVDKSGRYSEPVTAEYDIELDAPDAPSVYPDGGTFTQAASVYVSVPSGTTVYYTWDESIPDTDSEVYRGAIEIPEGNNVLSLVAIDENGMSSEVLKCNYIYYPQVQE